MSEGRYQEYADHEPDDEPDANANLSLLHTMTALHKIAGSALTPTAVANGLAAIDDVLADRTPEQQAYVAIVYVMAKLGRTVPECELGKTTGKERERMRAPEGYQFRVISRYSGEQGHLAGAEIETVAVTDDLDEAFRRKDESERDYSNAWVTIEKTTPPRRAGKKGKVE